MKNSKPFYERSQLMENGSSTSKSGIGSIFLKIMIWKLTTCMEQFIPTVSKLFLIFKNSLFKGATKNVTFLDMFSSFQFSPDNKKLMYIAEKKAPKVEPFYVQRPPVIDKPPIKPVAEDENEAEKPIRVIFFPFTHFKVKKRRTLKI